MLTRALIELSRPFPSKYVKDDGRGNSYVPHHIVNQRLIHIFGEPPRTTIVRELYDGEQLSGVVMRMEIAGLVVEEVGEADNPQAKTNGAKAKSAASDAYKRCAMRLSLGLHLWAQDDYFLFEALTKQLDDNQKEPPAAKAPSNGEEGGGPNHDVGKADGPAPPSDPKTKTKLLRFRARCIEKGTDADEEAAKLGIVSAERLNEEQLDRLLAEV